MSQPNLRMVAEKVERLAMGLMGSNQIVSDNFQAFLAAMEVIHPGFNEIYDRCRYMQNCLVAFRAQASARRGGTPDALQFLKETQETLDELKAMGEESGWQSAYIKAERGVVKEVQELERKEREAGKEAAKSKLEIVKS